MGIWVSYSREKVEVDLFDEEIPVEKNVDGDCVRREQTSKLVSEPHQEEHVVTNYHVKAVIKRVRTCEEGKEGAAESISS